LQVLATGDFEAPELETALLAAIDSPRHKLNAPLLEDQSPDKNLIID